MVTRKKINSLNKILCSFRIYTENVFQNLAVLNKTVTAIFTFVRNKADLVNFSRSVEEAVYHSTTREHCVTRVVVTETSLSFKKRNSQ